MNILLCPPTYYDIEYEINPWMHLEKKVDHKKARDSYEALKKIYQGLGVTIHEISPVKGLPDMVYCANYGYIFGHSFAASNFMHRQRQGEVQYAVEFFTQLGYKIINLPQDIYFEGQAELFKCGGKYILGWGKRSSREAKNHLEKIIERPIIDIELVDPYFYHLDTCFSYLPSGEVLINPKAFSQEGLAKIRETFDTVLETSDADNMHLACNLVYIEKNLVMAKGVTSSLKSKLSTLGYTVHEVDMQEYIKGGGSVRCLSLIFP